MKFGHVTGNKREKHGQPMFSMTAAERVAAWEAKQAAAAKTKAGQQ